MLKLVNGLRTVALIGVVALLGSTPVRALEPIDFNLSANSATATKALPQSAGEDDEDEDSFFSNGARNRNITGSVGSSSPMFPMPLARPVVDVAATCRAVLADNLNYYDHSFIQNCQRVVAQGARR